MKNWKQIVKNWKITDNSKKELLFRNILFSISVCSVGGKEVKKKEKSLKSWKREEKVTYFFGSWDLNFFIYLTVKKTLSEQKVNNISICNTNVVEIADSIREFQIYTENMLWKAFSFKTHILCLFLKRETRRNIVVLVNLECFYSLPMIKNWKNTKKAKVLNKKHLEIEAETDDLIFVYPFDF